MAKEKAQEIALILEKLHKEHRTVQRYDLKYHSEKLAAETDDALMQLEQIHKDILKNLEAHRKKIMSRNDFLRRHYRIK